MMPRAKISLVEKSASKKGIVFTDVPGMFLEMSRDKDNPTIVVLSSVTKEGIYTGDEYRILAQDLFEAFGVVYPLKVKTQIEFKVD